jgi:hypothetical protein
MFGGMFEHIFVTSRKGLLKTRPQRIISAHKKRKKDKAITTSIKTS